MALSYFVTVPGSQLIYGSQTYNISEQRRLTPEPADTLLIQMAADGVIVLANRTEQAFTRGDHSSATARETAALAVTPETFAFAQSFGGPDGSEQFRVEFWRNAVAYWAVMGGSASYGPTLSAWSDTLADVGGTIALKGNGNLIVGNGAGVLGGFIDPGIADRVFDYAAFIPGKLGSAAGITARNNADGTIQGGSRVDLALVPGSTGALCADIPDGTAVGGIRRGPRAVDWQRSRSSQNNVAQGDRSVIGGGVDNQCTSGALGAVIGGGSNNNLDGDYAWCPGGILASDRGRYATGVFSTGQFATRGDGQFATSALRAIATSATAARLTGDRTAAGASNVFNLVTGAIYRVKAMVLAHQASGSAGTAGDWAEWELDFVISRGSTAASTAVAAGRQVVAGSPPTLATFVSGAALAPSSNVAAAAAWRLSVSGDTTNGGINLTFTGEANKTVRIVAQLQSVEVVR